MKSPMNASYCQLLVLLTYILPMLDELFNGEPVEVGVINADTGVRGEPKHNVEVELPVGGTLVIKTVPDADGRWFIATCPIFDAPDHCEYAPALGAPAAELHEQCRSFALKLQAELKSDLARLRRVAQQQVEMLSKLDLE